MLIVPPIINNYIINNTEPLGSGLSSIVNKLLNKVYEAKNQETNLYVALKLFYKCNSIDNSISKMYQTEVKTLQLCNLLKNQNIVRLIQHFENCDLYVLVLERCDCKYFSLFEIDSLEKHLQKNKFLKEDVALEIFLQIYNGLSCLQNDKIFHRDIKPSNIMFKNNQIKIIDFGFCKKKIQNSGYIQQYSRCGTEGYEAPEVKKGDYDPEISDIYSLGVVYYEILYGLQIQKKKKEFTYPQERNVSEKTKTFIDMMIQEDYQKRISWKQIGEILKAIKSTQQIEGHQQFQLDENLVQKYTILTKILQYFKKLKKQKDAQCQNLELLLIKKVISEFEKIKVEFQEKKLEYLKQKLELEQKQLELLQENYEIHQLELGILQNHSLRTKLNKLINTLEVERLRSLNENKELKQNLCNDYFIKNYKNLNEELFMEQSTNFKQNLEREMKKFFEFLNSSENKLETKLLKIYILIIKFSDKDFENIKNQLVTEKLISLQQKQQQSIIEILDSIKDENIADKFEKCLQSLKQ